MIKLFLFWLLALCSQVASAQYYQEITQYRFANNVGGTLTYYYDPASYCAAKYPGSDGWTCKNTSVASTAVDKSYQTWRYEYCAGTNCSGIQSLNAQAYCAPPLQGPGAYPGVSYLRCNSTTAPGPDCTDTTSVFTVKQYYTGPSFLPNNFAGCVIKPVEYLSCWKGLTTSKEWCLFTVKRTGVVAPSGGVAAAETSVPADLTDGTRAPTATLPPDSTGTCPKGTVQAGVDSRDIPVCIGTGTAPKNPSPTIAPIVSKPPVTVTNADGSTTVTKETVYTNADGSTTTNKEVTTTATDGTVTKGGTSSTSNTPTGGAGIADKESDKTDLCKNNPTLSICRNSSVSGTCGDIVCDGDAVHCATLRYTAKMQCTQAKNEADIAALPSTTLGSAILAGNDPMKGQIDSALAGTSVNMSSSLDQSGFLARSCFGTKSFTVGGKTVTIEFASLCSGIEPIKYIILACAMLAAYLIVAKSVLGS